MNNEINDIFEFLGKKGLDNSLKREDIKSWLADYLEFYKEEANDYPEIEGEDHWDILVADYYKDKPASFFFVYFENDAFKLFGGIGECDSLVNFGESGFPEKPKEVEIELDNIIEDKSDVLVGKIDDLRSWLVS